MIWSYGASDDPREAAARIEVYHDQLNLVAGGTHGDSSSSIIQGSVAIVLLSVGLYVL